MGKHNLRSFGRRKGSEVRSFLEGLEGRQMLTVSISSIAPVSLPAAKTLVVPVQGTDSNGNPINYTVTSSNPGVTATVRSGHPFLDIKVAGYGDMVFQLFDDLTPNTVAEITKLVNQNFYSNLTFHRVVSNFVIQGGDPTGNGTGGPGFTFPNEFNSNLIFDGSGQLAMANSGPNTNGSQFFVTVGQQRFLDFNYNLFGQLVSGQSVLTAINSVAVDSNSKPLTPVTITSATIINDNHDTVLMIIAPSGTGSSNITVTGTDSVDGSSSSQTFAASYAADTTNDPPFLNKVSDQTTAVGTPLTFNLSSTDLENDTVTYTAKENDSSNNATVTVNGNQVTVTPKAGFTGSIPLQVTVQQVGATARGSTSNPQDIRTLNVNVVNPTVTATANSVSPVSGQSQTTTYGSFTAVPVSTASNFTATINFGDGSTGAGTVVANNSGGYDVVATHTYATAGTYPTNVMVNGPSSSTSTASGTATVVAPQVSPLTVTVTASPNPVRVGQELTYAIKVTNPGTTTITGISITDTLSAGLTFVSASTTPTSTTGGVITIPVGSLLAGASATINVVVRPTKAGTVSEQVNATSTSGASVSATQTSTVDPASAFGGGNIDTSIAKVTAPTGVKQKFINFTSQWFSQILSGRHRHYSGLATVIANFEKTGNVARLESAITRLAYKIPYGGRTLLPIWQATIASANLGTSSAMSAKDLGNALKQNLIDYLAGAEGKTINIFKSNARHATDNLLTYNGRSS